MQQETLKNSIFQFYKGDFTDYSKAEEVIVASELDYQVATLPVYVHFVNNETQEFTYKEMKNRVVTYRTDTKDLFEVVSDSHYEVVQNKEVFDFFDKLVEEGFATYVTAGSIKNGQEIFIIAKVNEGSQTLINDEVVDNYILLTTSHDGKKSIRVSFIPLRIACENQLNSILYGDGIIIRHSSQSENKLKQAEVVVKTYGETSKYAMKIMNNFIQTPLPEKDMYDIIGKVFLTKEEYQNFVDNNYIVNTDIISTRKYNLIREVVDYTLNDYTQVMLDQTCWKLFNGITGYYQHGKIYGSAEKRYASNILSSGGAFKNVQKTLNYLTAYCENYKK